MGNSLLVSGVTLRKSHIAIGLETFLGCSASLALAFPTPSHSQELVFTASSEPLPEAVSEFDCSCSSDSDAARLIDREGERAITLYGCDCAGCRYLVRQPLPESNQ